MYFKKLFRCLPTYIYICFNYYYVHYSESRNSFFVRFVDYRVNPCVLDGSNEFDEIQQPQLQVTNTVAVQEIQIEFSLATLDEVMKSHALMLDFARIRHILQLDPKKIGLNGPLKQFLSLSTRKNILTIYSQNVFFIILTCKL